jgi:deazaflavin-dependent oxidoreductase (nitroreductase family)
MAVNKLPSGTRGAGTPPRLVGKVLGPLMTRVHKRSGDRFQGMDLLYLTTVGARSGKQRTTPVARFDDGGGGWVVVASGGGSKAHPAWYHNIAAHPDEVWAEVSGTRQHVAVDQLDGEERDAAWAVVVRTAPRFAGYVEKTDRTLPVLRLRPTGGSDGG